MSPVLEPTQRVSDTGSKAKAATGWVVFANDIDGIGLYDVELDITDNLFMCVGLLRETLKLLRAPRSQLC